MPLAIFVGNTAKARELFGTKLESLDADGYVVHVSPVVRRPGGERRLRGVRLPQDVPRYRQLRARSDLHCRPEARHGDDSPGDADRAAGVRLTSLQRAQDQQRSVGPTRHPVANAGGLGPISVPPQHLQHHLRSGVRAKTIRSTSPSSAASGRAGRSSHAVSLHLEPRGRPGSYREMPRVLREEPAGTLVSLAADDTGQWCECPSCRALDGPLHGRQRANVDQE